MSTLGTPVLNLLSLTNSSSCCSSKTLTSSPHHYLPILSSIKPLKTLTFSHSTQPKSFSIITKNPNRFVLFIAQTSDWVQQEEDNDTMTTIEHRQGEEEEVFGNESENEGEHLGVISEDWRNQNEIEIESENESGEGNGEDYVESLEEAKVFVGNLPCEVDSERLAMLFERAGTVDIAEVIYNKETDRSRGFGFVTMSMVEEVHKAMDMFH